MIINRIIASELVEFADKAVDYFEEDIPITRERALSQKNNPFVKDEDVLLLVAEENHKLLGYIGILPAGTVGNTEERFYWNSCWWTHKSAGASVSMALLSEFMKITKNHVVFSDMSGRTQEIFNKLGFNTNSRKGIICSFRSGLHQRTAIHKWTGIKSLVVRVLRGSGIFKITDILVNAFLKLRTPKLPVSGDFKTYVLEEPDDECYAFIGKHSEHALTIPTADMIHWWKKYPWLKKSRKEDVKLQKRYYFSYLRKSFDYSFVKVESRGKMIGFAIISNREGVVKTLFLYYTEKNRELFFSALRLSIYGIKSAFRIVCFHEEFAEFLSLHKYDLQRSKMQYRFTALSEKILNLQKNILLSDGDGDYVFT